MSVTRDLAFGGGLSLLLDEHLRLAEPCSAYRQEIENAPTVDGLPGGWDGLGLTIEYAIGLDLSDRVPYQFILDGFPRHPIVKFVSAAGFHPVGGDPDVAWDSWCKAPGWPGPDARQGDLIIQFTDHIALYHALLRKTNWSRPKMREAMQKWWDGDIRDGRNPFENNHQIALPIWDVYLQRLRGRLIELGPAAAGVDLHQGFAMMDLMCGKTLLDVKTYEHPPGNCGYWLRQLAAYYLLDTDDAFDIDTVGIVLPRQGTLITWPIEQLFTSQALGRIPVLRQEAADIVRSTQEAIAARKAHRRR